jgi:phosphoribosylformylglycinamidine (FGAM) synthase PurS component
MSWLIEVALLPGIPDAGGRSTERKIREYLGVAVERVQVRQLYAIAEPGAGEPGSGAGSGITSAEARLAAEELFHDPVIQRYSLNKPLPAEPFSFSVVVGYRPGVTDNVGRTAAEALADLLGRTPEAEVTVSTATQYLISGVSADQARRIARELLANDLIESTEIQSFHEWQQAGTRIPAGASAAGFSRNSGSAAGVRQPSPRGAMQPQSSRSRTMKAGSGSAGRRNDEQPPVAEIDLEVD